MHHHSTDLCCPTLLSCLPHSDCLSGRHHCEVWDLGHSGSRALPQPGSDVLQRRSGSHRGLRHHQHSMCRATDGDLSVSCNIINSCSNSFVVTFSFSCAEVQMTKVVVWIHPVWAKLIKFCCSIGHFCTSEKLGEGAAETSQSQHSDRSGWKQGRHCKQESCRSSGMKYKSTLRVQDNDSRYW